MLYVLEKINYNENSWSEEQKNYYDSIQNVLKNCTDICINFITKKINKDFDVYKQTITKVNFDNQSKNTKKLNSFHSPNISDISMLYATVKFH